MISAYRMEICEIVIGDDHIIGPAPTDTIAAHGVEAVAGNGDMITVKKVDRVMKVLEFGLRNADIAAVPDVPRHGIIRRISVEQAMHINSDERRVGKEGVSTGKS